MQFFYFFLLNSDLVRTVYYCYLVAYVICEFASFFLEPINHKWGGTAVFTRWRLGRSIRDHATSSKRWRLGRFTIYYIRLNSPRFVYSMSIWWISLSNNAFVLISFFNRNESEIFAEMRARAVFISIFSPCSCSVLSVTNVLKRGLFVESESWILNGGLWGCLRIFWGDEGLLGSRKERGVVTRLLVLCADAKERSSALPPFALV